MAKKKVVQDIVHNYVPPKWWFFNIGEKYYRRLQPIPYKKSDIPKYILICKKEKS
jgi:hypothetical protein